MKSPDVDGLLELKAELHKSERDVRARRQQVGFGHDRGAQRATAGPYDAVSDVGRLGPGFVAHANSGLDDRSSRRHFRRHHRAVADRRKPKNRHGRRCENDKAAESMRLSDAELQRVQAALQAKEQQYRMLMQRHGSESPSDGGEDDENLFGASSQLVDFAKKRDEWGRASDRSADNLWDRRESDDNSFSEDGVSGSDAERSASDNESDSSSTQEPCGSDFCGEIATDEFGRAVRQKKQRRPHRDQQATGGSRQTNAEDVADDCAHFDSRRETREMGAGFYQFSQTNEAQRARQMQELRQLRLETHVAHAAKGGRRGSPDGASAQQQDRADDVCGVQHSAEQARVHAIIERRRAVQSRHESAADVVRAGSPPTWIVVAGLVEPL